MRQWVETELAESQMQREKGASLAISVFCLLLPSPERKGNS
jgi:hypothetical protein